VIRKLAVSGQLRAGKDNIAELCDYVKFGFADPMYDLARYFFGDQPKDQTRRFLQFVGQWGWGKVDNDVFRLTPERAVFVDLIRRHGHEMVDLVEYNHVRWFNFGRTKSFWVDIFLDRVENALKKEPDMKIAVVNVRFEHELEPLIAAGFEHYHVMASLPSITERLERLGKIEKRAAWIPEIAPHAHGYVMQNVQDLREALSVYRGWDNKLIQEMTDTSEQLALKFNREQSDDRIIWNDSRELPVGKSYLTRDAFRSIATN